MVTGKGYGGSFWGTGHVLFLVQWGLDGRLLHESTELDSPVLCTFLEVYYIHNESVLLKGKKRLNQIPSESNSFFHKIEYLSHTFQEPLVLPSVY